MKEDECRLCEYYSQNRCTHVPDFSIAGLMRRPTTSTPHPVPPLPMPLPPPHDLWMTNDALLLSAYFFKLGISDIITTNY